jgi:hypothetical protein
VTEPNPSTFAAMMSVLDRGELTVGAACRETDRLIDEAVATERDRYTDLIEACREHFCLKWNSETGKGVRRALAALDEDTP